ncbi:MAG: ATP-binding cassette domain-containing protein [Deltaproteobacteria bacterium]|nr:ATP-binding cassette domain-containing protein [Deltaproteobacteria bacterium]
MRPLYSVELFGFSYPDGTQALKRMSFEIMPKECIGVLGANGSGKTTLLKILDGILKNYKGKVELDGIDIRKLSPKEIYKRVGLLFQDPDDQLFANTVFEDVAFGPMNMGYTRMETIEKVKLALKDVELEGFEDKKIQDLSFGQKKRVCIAGLLAMGQDVLLLDEPLSGLDPMGEQKMLELLKFLNKHKGVTMVIASHNVDMAPLLFDRVFVLRDGEIVCSGSPKEVFQDINLIRSLKLRLPYVGELFWKVRDLGNLSIPVLPLTVEDGHKTLLRLLRKE